MLMNAIQLDDIEIPQDELDSPSTKAFINIIGAMIYSSDSFVAYIKSNTSQIIDRLAANESLKALPEAYDQYSDLKNRVKAQFGEYESASKAFEQSKREALQHSQDQTTVFYTNLAEKWQKSQNAFTKEEIIRKSLDIKRGLSDYFQGKDECQSRPKYEQRCLIKLEEIYRDTVSSETGRYVAPDYWCYSAKEQYVTKTIRGEKESFS